MTWWAIPSDDVDAIADFNADGHPDLAISNLRTSRNASSGSINILLSYANGGFAPPTQIPAGPAPTFLTVADFNEDGKFEMAAKDDGGNPQILILRGNGDGGFAPTGTFASGLDEEIAVVDFNGDGYSDLVSADTNSFNVIILGGTGSGGSSSPASFAARGGPPWWFCPSFSTLKTL